MSDTYSYGVLLVLVATTLLRLYWLWREGDDE
jgi:hypothetical protein